MMISFRSAIRALFMILGLASCSTAGDEVVEPTSCASNPLALQVLGSGGPIADDHRAGSSNIVWIDGKARVLIDAGPGSFVRFGEAGARFEDLTAILLTHFHGDHVGGLPGLLNAGSFSRRTDLLLIAGPDGSETFPSTSELLAAYVGSEGALRYLAPYLDGSADLPRLNVRNIVTSRDYLQAVWRLDGVDIDTVAVKHLEVPALAFVVRHKGKRLLFAGDQSFLSEGFVEATRNGQPDLMVMHNAISMADGQPRGLHRDGRSIGEAARAAGAKKLVLTHHMQRALDDRDAVMAAIRESYTGPVEFADDLSCFPVE
ncbi:Ribonuclease BN, tRNA processing enzyme [Parasphingorhabdus marina DSM 22363]|uniref:Ribonuclease BN, tRNA processing enzyme n=1 Tax=Parasphingorhabdus marina DSM 22363 TaxID=1123272 RepID=A0A1N6EP77_9SPHN|nr:MBL fold metallo-hydrolase [Parasphingorhabdus marina]SIN84733.1 Ribonuclease BN, tRNA processing enzyme [Parasphingorhabdus marina DSM 22363]